MQTCLNYIINQKSAVCQWLPQKKAFNSHISVLELAELRVCRGEGYCTKYRFPQKSCRFLYFLLLLALAKRELNLRCGSDAGIVSVWRFGWFFVFWWNTFSAAERKRINDGAYLFWGMDFFFYFRLCLEHFTARRSLMVKQHKFYLPSWTIRAGPRWKWPLFCLFESSCVGGVTIFWETTMRLVFFILFFPR